MANIVGLAVLVTEFAIKLIKVTIWLSVSNSIRVTFMPAFWLPNCSLVPTKLLCLCQLAGQCSFCNLYSLAVMVTI